jgi:predicted transcriptional regulator
MSRKEIFTKIGMRQDTRSYARNVKPLMLKGLIEMTLPDKPNSRLQKYKLTDKGKAQFESHS